MSLVFRRWQGAGLLRADASASGLPLSPEPFLLPDFPDDQRGLDLRVALSQEAARPDQSVNLTQVKTSEVLL